MSGDGPLDLTTPSSGRLYTDLSDSYVEAQFKITLANGNAFPDEAANVVIAPGNNFFHSLFSSTSVRFYDTVVEYKGNYIID